MLFRSDILSIIEKVENVKVLDSDAVTNTSAMKISDYYLNTLKSLSLINYGSLKFDESITPDMLEEKLVKIENFGVIKCPENLYGIIMQKVKVNHGVIKAIDPNKEVERQENEKPSTQVISNLGTYEF